MPIAIHSVVVGKGKACAELTSSLYMLRNIMSPTKNDDTLSNVPSISTSRRYKACSSLLKGFCVMACLSLAALIPLAFFRIHRLENSVVTKTEFNEALKEFTSRAGSGRLQSISPVVSPMISESRSRRATSSGCVCPPGPKGDPGPRGERGRKGPDGRKGKDGDKGEKGDRGTDGMKGELGTKGQVGLPGPRGIQGPMGPTGEKGEAGNDGVNGTKGSEGQKGDKGDVGPQGLPGELGPQGPEGPEGSRGQRGPKGSTGEPGVSPTLPPSVTSLQSVLDTLVSNHTSDVSKIEIIHVRGIPDNEASGLSRLDVHGVFKSWEVAFSSYGFQMNEDGNITVAEDGLYFLYTNVLFYESSSYYGASTNINGNTFLQCVGSRSSPYARFGPCSTAGVAELNAGDRVGIVGNFPMRMVDMRPEATYFGMIKLR